MNPARAKLLIVDQSESMRSKLREQMHDLGFVRVDETADAPSAITLVLNNHYDLVICEWNGSQFSGLQLVRAVRDAPMARSTPFLLISEDGSAKRTVEALEAGANGLLVKPYSEARLGDKVMRIVSSAEPAPAVRAEHPHGDDTWLPSR